MPPKRRIALSLLGLVVLSGALLAALGGAPGEGPALRRVVILHTNDVHGQVLPRVATWLEDRNPPPDSGGLPRLAATLRRELARLEEEGVPAFVCDGGDWFQGTPEGQIERGAAFLGALQEVGHDAMVVGNHEFDHGVDVFLEHLEGVELPAMLANARDAAGDPLPGTRDHVIVERGGFTVAFVGLLTTSTPAITHAQTRELVWTEPAEALARVRGGLPAGVDLVVPVTHIGVEGDVELARAHPDLPLIVGGHSHTFLRTGVREGDTLIVQAGAKASVIGRVDLWLDGDGSVERAEARHIEMYEEPGEEWRNGRVDALCGALVERAAKRMDEVVGELTGPLDRSRRELVNSTAGNLIADLIRERAGADVAIHNRGGIRANLAAGEVTRRDLFSILPFDNTVETVTLTGAEVIELFRRSVEEVRGGGFEFSGATLVGRREGGKPRFVELRVGGEALDPEAEVTLATNSYLARGGDGLRVLERAEERVVDAIVLRDLLEIAFADGPVTPPSDQRYEIVR